MSIDVRSTSLALLTLMASIVFLEWAQAVLIPITFAVLLSYALTPVVNGLKRIAKAPKAVGAALTLSVVVGAFWTKPLRGGRANAGRTTYCVISRPHS